MHEYQDYFDTDKREEPYNTFREEREDYLSLLDMILESILEHKGLHSTDRLYSRGLVITENELKDYYEMPPVFRRADVCNPLLREWVREAFEHIRLRSESTLKQGLSGEKDSVLRIWKIRELFCHGIRETLALLIALAYDTDRRYERIFGFLQDDVSMGEPTEGLLNALVGRAFSNDDLQYDDTLFKPLDNDLFNWLFVYTEERGLRRRLLLNQPVLEILTGADIGELLRSNGAYLYTEEEDIPVFFEEYTERIRRAFLEGGDFFYLENKDSDTVLHLLYAVSQRDGYELYVLKAAKLLDKKPEEREELMSLLSARLRLNKAYLAVSIRDIPDKEDTWQTVSCLIKRMHPSGCVAVFGKGLSHSVLSAEGIPSVPIEEPGVGLRIAIWDHFLRRDDRIGLEDDVNIPDIADCHEMSYGMIKRVCDHARSVASLKEEKSIGKAALMESLRQINSPDLASYATPINASYTWDDITIEPSQLAILHTACDRYRLRNRIGEAWGLKRSNAYGQGVSLLLYGPAGTGKTMAAQVIANELSLPLYRVDTSRIFSKYIGETEKNLSVIFEAAEGADVILFFDEADALFSKRTEISGSNDKYSNSETAHLLQKIEEYNGMSILATNYYQNFDSAFVRRITYAAHLESPGEELRYILWSTMLPREAETEPDIDYHFLAKQFKLSGSNIKAILYSAAYMAGAEGRKLGMAHIARALQYEYKKQGRLIDGSEFGKLMVYL